jgi:uncharacterized membrane protein
VKPHPWLVVVFVGALIGVVFAGLSTYDFVQHLDRQVHSLHCSFVPGGKAHGASGCQVAMMSEYSSVLRARVWGGIPIALPAMAVFAFLGCYAIDLMLTRRKDDPRATGFLALAAALPAAVSLMMLFISLTRLGTTCVMCVSVYIASALCLAGGIALWRRAVRLDRAGGAPLEEAAPRRPKREPHGGEPAFTGAGVDPVAATEPALDQGRARPLEPSTRGPAAGNQFLAAAFGVGVVFVAVPVLVYLAMAPDHGRFIGTCDGLAKPEDTYKVMVRVDHQSDHQSDREPGRVPALEILDPLCPACAAFEKRLESSGYRGELDRRAILFPLDNTCNWMVTEATHPGACTVSEAVLCAGDRSPEVIAWAFQEQERIRNETKKDPAAAARIVRERFPDLGTCVGSPEARSRLNKSLRWAVSNNIRVLTPQLFIANVKLCDEDVDLGLAYSLRVMLERHAAGTLTAPGAGASGKPGEATDPAADKAGKSDATGTDKAGKADKPASTGTGTDKADKPAAGTDKTDKDKPAATGTDKADKPAATGTDKADKPAAGTDKPAAGTDKPAAGTDKPADKADKPADKPDKPAEPPATDKPITSPTQAPEGGAP